MTYYNVEIGHLLKILPDDVGELTPADLIGASHLFDAIYRPGD